MKKRNHAFAELDKYPSTSFSKSERRPTRKSRQPLKRKAICRPCLLVCFPFTLAAAEVEVVTSGYSMKATKMEGAPLYIYKSRGMDWYFIPNPDATQSTSLMAKDPRSPHRSWIMTAFGKKAKDADKQKSSLMNVEADCRRWTYNSASLTYFSGAFVQGVAAEDRILKLDEIPMPGSIADNAMHLACPKE